MIYSGLVYINFLFFFFIQLQWLEPIADVVYLSSEVCRKYDEPADGEEIVLLAVSDRSVILDKNNSEVQSLTKVSSESVINVVEFSNGKDSKEVEIKSEPPQVSSSGNAKQGGNGDLKSKVGGLNESSNKGGEDFIDKNINERDNYKNQIDRDGYRKSNDRDDYRNMNERDDYRNTNNRDDYRRMNERDDYRSRMPDRDTYQGNGHNGHKRDRQDPYRGREQYQYNQQQFNQQQQYGRDSDFELYRQDSNRNDSRDNRRDGDRDRRRSRSRETGSHHRNQIHDVVVDKEDKSIMKDKDIRKEKKHKIRSDSKERIKKLKKDEKESKRKEQDQVSEKEKQQIIEKEQDQVIEKEQGEIIIGPDDLRYN